MRCGATYFVLRKLCLTCFRNLNSAGAPEIALMRLHPTVHDETCHPLRNALAYTLLLLHGSGPVTLSQKALTFQICKTCVSQAW